MQDNRHDQGNLALPGQVDGGRTPAARERRRARNPRRSRMGDSRRKGRRDSQRAQAARAAALHGCISARAVRERRAARANHDAQWDDVPLRLCGSKCASSPNSSGRPVSIWPIQPPTERDFLKRAAPDNPDMMAELREVFGRLENEPLPDLSTLPPTDSRIHVAVRHLLRRVSLPGADDRVVERARQSQSHRRFRLAPLPSQRFDRDRRAESKDWSKPNGRDERFESARPGSRSRCPRCDA